MSIDITANIRKEMAEYLEKTPITRLNIDFAEKICEADPCQDRTLAESIYVLDQQTILNLYDNFKKFKHVSFN